MTTTKVSAAWDALEAAALEHTASCAGDDRFTLDDAPAALAAVCGECAIFTECRAYAVTARPAAGYWAGRRYGSIPRPRKEAS